MTRDFFFKNYLYGDKETYWVAFEMLGIYYSVSPIPIALLGFIKNDTSGIRVCSRNLLHFKEDQSPLWINSGLVINKAGNLKIQKFDAYSIDYGELNHYWRTEYDCIIFSKIYLVDGELRENINRLIYYWKNDTAL